MIPDEPSEPRSLRLEFRAVIATFLFASLLPLLGGLACSSDRAKAQRGRQDVENQSHGDRSDAERLPG